MILHCNYNKCSNYTDYKVFNDEISYFFHQKKKTPEQKINKAYKNNKYKSSRPHYETTKQFRSVATPQTVSKLGAINFKKHL